MHTPRHRTLAIDPGPEVSGWCVIDTDTHRPHLFGITENKWLLAGLNDPNGDPADTAVIEMVASYGMAVGAEVFDTCVWIGRFHEALRRRRVTTELVYRREVKLHHCHSAAAKDGNIVQALIDRYARGVRNRGKGTKDDPGWFYGFRADVWQAYALAVYAADTIEHLEEA